MKALKNIAKQTEAAAAIRKMASVIEGASVKKYALKERQLRFACIYALPDSEAKTKLLLQMLSAEQNEKENSSFSVHDDQRPDLVESADSLAIENLRN